MWNSYIKNIIRSILFRSHSPIWYLRKGSLILSDYGNYSRRKKIALNFSSFNISSLHHKGWTDELEIEKNLLDTVISYCNEISVSLDPLNQPPQFSTKKNFWRILVNKQNIDQHPVIKDFAKNSYFLKIASAYIGAEAVLSNVTLMKSYPTDWEFNKSQLWHLDGDDNKFLVFYLYCNIVDRNSGAFELIPKHFNKRRFIPRYFRKPNLLDAEVRKYSEPDQALEITGNSGKLFACDTAQVYHRGSRCKSNIRLALSIRYTSQEGLFPFDPIH